MNIATLLGIIAGLLQLPSCYLYNKYILQGTIRPSIVSWGIWALLTILSTTTYHYLTNDVIISILPLTISLAIIITFLCILYRENFSLTYDHWNVATLIIGFISIVIWYALQSATYANLILQIASCIAYIPTYRNVKQHPHYEPLLPWILWTIAYVLGGIVVLLRWTEQYEALVYPILNILTSGNITYIIIQSKINNKK